MGILPVLTVLPERALCKNNELLSVSIRLAEVKTLLSNFKTGTLMVKSDISYKEIMDETGAKKSGYGTAPAEKFIQEDAALMRLYINGREILHNQIIKPQQAFKLTGVVAALGAFSYHYALTSFESASKS